MSSNFTLRTVTEYLALPELEIPAIPNEEGVGRICDVLDVDFYIALKSDCDLHGLEALEIPNIDRCALPTVVVEMEDEQFFFRLPQSLASWACDSVLRSNSEQIFPAFIAFGILHDHHFAKFL